MAVGWKGLAASANALNHVERMRQALAALQVLAPDEPTTPDTLNYLKANRPDGK